MKTPSQSGRTSGGIPFWEPPSPEELSAALPAYEVNALLGRGGMGAVYRAVQRSLKREVAIKVLAPTADDELKFAERFRHKAETLARLNHPGIVHIHDFGETADGLLYLVMEFVDGTDVHQLIQGSGRLSEDYALAITAHVCDALTYAHSRGVVHRDIKPANVLIDQDGNVKVADFGLAKMVDPQFESGLTMSNVALGTPDYVAPEVLSYGMVADHRADLYAVGVMLYQMLTGEVPRGLFKLPSQKGIGADPRFDDIICKAMEPDRDERYQSATDVRAALDVILTTALPKEEEAVKQKMKSTRAPGDRVRAPATRSSFTGLWLGIGAFVAVLGLGVYIVFGGKPKSAVEGPADFAAVVAAAPAEQQVELVVKKINALNGSEVSAKQTIENGVVTGLILGRGEKGDGKFNDLSPISALRHLTELHLYYLETSDISFLRGMKIEQLTIHGGNFAVDALRELPLTYVAIRSPVADFSVLAGKALTSLDLSVSPLRDISFVKGMPLKRLIINRTAVDDLSPIRGLPLEELVYEVVPGRDTEILRAIPTLKSINEMPVAEFWASVGAQHTSNGITQGNTIDLLKSVDLKSDVIAGDWYWDPGGLKSRGSGMVPGERGGYPRVEFPQAPPPEYDFEVEFTADTDELDAGVVFSIGGKQTALIMNIHGGTGYIAGLDGVGGAPMHMRLTNDGRPSPYFRKGARQIALVQVRKDHVTAMLDGEIIEEWTAPANLVNGLALSDDYALSDPAYLGLLAAPATPVVFHRVVVREVTDSDLAGVGNGTTKTASLANNRPDTEKIDWLKSARWDTRWSLENGRVQAARIGATRYFGVAGDGSVRVRFREAPADASNSPPLQLSFRGGPNGNSDGQESSYLFQIHPARKLIQLLLMTKNTRTKVGVPEFLLKDLPLPLAAPENGEVELEMRAIGEELSLWSGSTQVTSIRDTRSQSGAWVLSVDPGVEITALETSGIKPNAGTISPPQTGNGPPLITDWQDMTESVRETAQSIPELVVESDQIRHVGQGTSPRIQLSPDGLRDYAVRLHFTGESQVNLRRDDFGFIYVLCQRSQTIFQRYNKDKANPTVLIPTLLHPPGYDSTQPHELLVTMEGSTIRTWLDGRFLGEAHDDTLANGCADVAFTKYCTVQKVEFAELKPSPSVTSADWQPLFTKPEDFAADAANVEIRDGWLFANTAKTHYAPTDSIDGAIRANLRFRPQHTADLTARANDGAPWGKEAYACSVFITPDGKTATIMNTMEKIDGEKPWKRHDFPLPAALREGEEFALELRVEGDQIAVLFNGKKLGSVTHPFPATNRYFGIMTSMTGVSEFRDVAWQKLE